MRSDIRKFTATQKRNVFDRTISAQKIVTDKKQSARRPQVGGHSVVGGLVIVRPGNLSGIPVNHCRDTHPGTNETQPMLPICQIEVVGQSAASVTTRADFAEALGQPTSLDDSRLERVRAVRRARPADAADKVGKSGQEAAAELAPATSEQPYVARLVSCPSQIGEGREEAGGADVSEIMRLARIGRHEHQVISAGVLAERTIEDAVGAHQAADVQVDRGDRCAIVRIIGAAVAKLAANGQRLGQRVEPSHLGGRGRPQAPKAAGVTSGNDHVVPLSGGCCTAADVLLADS